MVRAKYGGYPTDIPDQNTSPFDGYLVYYGGGNTVSDTNMDFNNTTLQVFYKAWAQKLDGTWYTDTSSGSKESVNLIELAHNIGQFLPLLIVLGFTLIAYITHWKLLIFLAGLMIMFYAFYLNTTDIFTANKLYFSFGIGVFGFLVIIYGLLSPSKR